MGLQAFVVAGVLAVGLAFLALLAWGTSEDAEPDAAAAQRVALTWTGAELADPPRRVGDTWEIDVRRPDGSLVEVTLDRSLRLRELDEELGRDGTPAHDEVAGEPRRAAIAAARSAAGPGAVRRVERERDGTIEVDFLAPNQTVIEVELDQRLRVKDVDKEEIGDE
jgi:hypothetical protein